MIKRLLFSIIISLPILILSQCAQGQVYHRDSTFGVHGICRIKSTDTFNGMGFNGWGNGFLFNNDKILAIHSPQYSLSGFGFVAEHGLIEFTNNGGKIDSSFGSNGIAVVNLTPLSSISSNGNFPWCTAKLFDGRILEGGQKKFEAIPVNYLNSVVCFKTDGLIDSSFGNNGVLIFTSLPGSASSGDSRVVKIMPQSGTRILLHCQVNSAENNRIIAINQNGIIDSSYGINGVQDFTNLELPNEFQFYAQSTLLSSGEILVGAISYDSLSWVYNYDYLVLLKPNGSVDSNFGIFGKKILDTNVLATSTINDVLSNRMKSRSDKKSFSLMHDKNGIYNILIRFNYDGSVDSNFGNQGIVNFPFNSSIGNFNSFTLLSYAILENDKIVLTGRALDSNATNFMDILVILLNPDGKIDSSFASNGIAIIDGGANLGDQGNIIISADSNSFVVCGSDFSKYYVMVKFKRTLSPNYTEPIEMDQLKIYPNPTNELISISSPIQIDEVNIYNHLGQLCLKQRVYQANCKLNVSMLNPGIYNIKCRLLNGKVVSEHLVVE